MQARLFKDKLQVTTDRVESGQLAAHVDDEDDDDWLLVAALLEELVDGDSGLSVGGLPLHLFQLSEHLVGAASQPQQRCRVTTTSSSEKPLWCVHRDNRV